MIYFSGAASAVSSLDREDVGVMLNPGMGNAMRAGTKFAADNGCFAAKWTEGSWLDYVARPEIANAMFVVVPDVVCDAAATYERWLKYRPMVDGYRTAFVLQNGATDEIVPWSELDVLFVGGDNLFKLGWVARDFVAQARALGKWTHMGRVNSWQRILVAAKDGYDSVDGTFLKYGPSINLPQLLSWLDRINRVEDFS